MMDWQARITLDPKVLVGKPVMKRIVVTHDKDFGDLAFRSGLPASCGSRADA